MESSVKHFWNEMTERASAVAEGAKDAVNDAGRFVGEKKNSAMLYIDLARLKNDCEEIYSEIGRTFYRMQRTTASNASTLFAVSPSSST